MTALEPTSGALPPTATYNRREWEWLPAAGGEILGTLVTLVTKGRRVLRTQVDHYRVQEELDLELPAGVRSFLLENELAPDPDGPFRCVVGALREFCGCESQRLAGRQCKHVDALRAIVASGVM